MSRPDMRFAPVKSADQPAVLMPHKTREWRVKQRTMSVNALRSQRAELSLVVAKGVSRIDALSELAENDASRPQEAREAAKPLTLPSEGRTRSIDAMERAKSPRPAPAARPAAGSTAFPGLARSSPRRLRQASPTRAPSSRGATSPLGWG